MNGDLAVFPIVMYLAGGLALFLYGLDVMSDALRVVAGTRLRSMLAKMTESRLKGAAAGAIVTALIQSSSVTTVLVVGFVSAGLMSLQQSIALIFGANIGTTVTAQIIAFKVTQYSLVLVAAGFGMHALARGPRLRRWGHVVMGIGFVFFGMQLMSDGASPLRSYAPFIDVMRQMSSPVYGILAGAVFTALVQSSAATMGLVIMFATQGVITLTAGIALALGANIGTCITAFLAGFGKPVDAKRAAAVHILFNVIGVLIWVGLIDYLAELVRWMSPAAEGLSGAERLAAETPRQIANAHTVFNVANTVLLLGLTGPMAWLVRALVRDRPRDLPAEVRPKYLDDVLIPTPGLALDRAHLELGRLGALATTIIEAAPAAVLRGGQIELDELQQLDDNLDTLHGSILDYLRRVAEQDISGSDSRELSRLLTAARYIENIGDIIETSLVEEGLARVEAGLDISEETERVLSEMYGRVARLVRDALQAVSEEDRDLAAAVVGAKSEISAMANRAEAHLAERLIADEPNRLVAFRIETDIIENLKRIYYFAKRLAKLVLENGGGSQAVEVGVEVAAATGREDESHD